jgi:hypothetical protein
MTPIEEVFARLSKAADQLNSETDTLNQVLESVDERMGAMNIGVPCWDDDVLDLEPEDDPKVSHGYRIGYAKLGDGWHLVAQCIRVEEVVNDFDEKEQVKDPYGNPFPLLDGPRILRLEALYRIEPLLERISQLVESFVEQIGDAKDRLTE